MPPMIHHATIPCQYCTTYLYHTIPFPCRTIPYARRWASKLVTWLSRSMVKIVRKTDSRSTHSIAPLFPGYCIFTLAAASHTVSHAPWLATPHCSQTASLSPSPHPTLYHTPWLAAPHCSPYYVFCPALKCHAVPQAMASSPTLQLLRIFIPPPQHRTVPHTMAGSPRHCSPPAPLLSHRTHRTHNATKVLQAACSKCYYRGWGGRIGAATITFQCRRNYWPKSHEEHHAAVIQSEALIITFLVHHHLCTLANHRVLVFDRIYSGSGPTTTSTLE